MKRLLLFLLFAAGAASAQTDNTFYVKTFPGSNVGAKTIAAQRACAANTAIPCLIIFDPSLAVYAPGVTPAKCVQCVWQDWRSGTGVLPAPPAGGGPITATTITATGDLIVTETLTPAAATIKSTLAPYGHAQINLDRGAVGGFAVFDFYTGGARKWMAGMMGNKTAFSVEDSVSGADPFSVAVGAPADSLSIDSAGAITSVPLKASTGTRFVCVDSTGKLVSQITACSGT